MAERPDIGMVAGFRRTLCGPNDDCQCNLACWWVESLCAYIEALEAELGPLPGAWVTPFDNSAGARFRVLTDAEARKLEVVKRG